MRRISRDAYLTSLAGGAALSLLAGSADAGEASYRLSIPPKPYADALIDLGLQANVTVVGTSACGDGGRVGLAGAYSLAEALARLTEGAPCVFRILDPRSVRISPAAAPATEVREPIRPTTLIGEVLVTATKRPALTGRVAAGVSVLARDQIELTGASDVTRTTGQLAGVLTTNLGPGRDKLLVRGLSDGAFTGRTRSTVSTYLDDAPINYNAPDPALRLVDIDRIEVLRGPQGALYGSGSLSGIYRIVTAKPELDRRGGGISAQVAATEGGSPSRQIEAYGNLPLFEGRVAVRAVGYHDVQGGYIDDVNLRLSNVDRTRRDGGRLAVRLQPSDDWQVDILLTGQRLRSNDTQYTTVERNRANKVRETHKNDFTQAGATIRGELGWASLSSSLAYVQHNYGSHYDASRGLENFGADASGVGVYIERARVGMLVQDLVLRSRGAGRFGWLAGAYAAVTEEKSPSSLATRTATTPLDVIYREDRKDRLRELAVYGEGSYEFTPGWTASVGGRLFQTRVETSATVVAQSPGESRQFERDQTFSGLSPKLSLQWELSSGNLFYALLSEGYRPGGFNSGGFLAIRPSRTTFAADRLRNYEAGAKLRLLDRRLALRTAVFYDQWRNIQTDQYRPSGLSYTANVGDARIAGLEAEAGLDFGHGLTLQANVLVSSSQLTRTNPDFAIRGASDPPLPLVDKLPGVPNESGGLLAIYQRPLRQGLTLRLAGEASYVGRSALSFDASRQQRMGDYLRATLSAEVAARTWSAALFVTNPTNDAGDTFAYGNPFSFGEVRQVTPQRPRTVSLRLAAAF